MAWNAETRKSKHIQFLEINFILAVFPPPLEYFKPNFTFWTLTVLCEKMFHLSYVMDFIRNVFKDFPNSADICNQ